MSRIDYRVLAGLFRHSTMREVARWRGPSSQDLPIADLWLNNKDVVGDLLKASGCRFRKGMTLGEAFDHAYRLLARNYRIEYVYKNALLLSQSIGSLVPGVLEEFNTADCRADFVVLKDTPIIFEIKTELDSLARLRAQIESYFRVCDQVWIVTHNKSGWLSRVEREVTDAVGIAVLDKGKLETLRPATAYRDWLDIEKILLCLRECELREVVRDKLGFIYEGPNTLRYVAYKNLFLTLELKEAYEAMGLMLCRRRPSNPISFMQAVPRSLKCLAVATRLTRKQRSVFLERLGSPA